GAVGTDQAGDPPRLDREGRVVDGGHPTELDHDVVNLEQCHRLPPPPAGRRTAGRRGRRTGSARVSSAPPSTPPRGARPRRAVRAGSPAPAVRTGPPACGRA